MLNNIYTTVPIAFSVASTRVYGPRTVIDFNQAYPWANYSLLLSQDTTGVSFEGFSFNGATYWNPAPAMLFRTDASLGQSWSTPLGQVSLISTTATVEAASQKFTDVYLYSVGSSSQIWGFKPGYGVVSFTINGIEFKLTSGTAVPYAPPFKTTVNRTCPAPGLTAIPEDGMLSDALREGILQAAMSAGSKNLIVGAAWSELEPSQGTYNLARITKELQLATKYKLPTVFNLRVPQTSGPALPNYLAGKALNDATVLARLNALLSRIAPLLPSEVKWVNVGYEVDTYAFLNTQGLAPFLTMFDSARATLRLLKPNMSVGSVFSFDSSRASDQMYRAIVSRGDHVAFTYYALTGAFEQRAPSSPSFDIPLMTSMAGGKPVLLVELGYSSGWAGQALQSQFLSNAFTALRQAGDAISMFSVWSYRDIPASTIAALSAQFGQSSPAFKQFITTAGLIDENSVPKTAWSTFLVGAAAFASTSGCTGL